MGLEHVLIESERHAPCIVHLKKSFEISPEKLSEREHPLLVGKTHRSNSLFSIFLKLIFATVCEKSYNRLSP